MATTTIEPATRSRGRAHRYREAAKILNVSDRHIIRLIRDGKLKATYLGPRSPRIFDDAIDAYVAAQEGES
jgi:excisionase family DNA binding protein